MHGKQIQKILFVSENTLNLPSLLTTCNQFLRQ
jgi:hypothetical protein